MVVEAQAKIKQLSSRRFQGLIATHFLLYVMMRSGVCTDAIKFLAFVTNDDLLRKGLETREHIFLNSLRRKMYTTSHDII